MGRTKACQQRLRLLYQHGLVRRIALPIRRGDKPKPYVYALDRKGAELLVTELGIEPAEIDWKTKSRDETAIMRSCRAAKTHWVNMVLPFCARELALVLFVLLSGPEVVIWHW